MIYNWQEMEDTLSDIAESAREALRDQMAAIGLTVREEAQW